MESRWRRASSASRRTAIAPGDEEVEAPGAPVEDRHMLRA